MQTEPCLYKRRIGKKVVILCAAVAMAWMLNIERCWAQTQEGPVRARIFSLKKISVDEAKEYLAKVGIGDSVLHLPGTNAISVTAKPAGLVEASAFIELVDTAQKYEIKTLELNAQNTEIEPQDIAAELAETVAVGTFMDPPMSKELSGMIVDIRQDSILLVLPSEQSAKIVETIEEMKKRIIQAKAQKESAMAEELIEPVESDKTEAIDTAKGQKDDMLDDMLTELEVEALTAEPDMAASYEKIKMAAALAEEIKSTKTELEPVLKEQAAAVTAEPQDQSEELKDGRSNLVIPDADEILELDLPEKVDVVALLDLMARYLDLDYLYDENEIKGTVTLKVQGPIKVKDLYEYVESVMRFRGFVMSRKENLVTILPIAKVNELDSTFTATGAKPGDIVVTSVFHLKHIATSQAKTMLVALNLGSNTTITELPETGTLLITEYAYRMERIEQLLELIDVPGPPKIFKFRQLKYTMVANLVPQIKALAEQLRSVSVTIAAKQQPAATKQPARAARRATKPKPPAGAAGDKQQDGVYIDYDERTNRVLIIGQQGEVEIIEELIDSFDVPQQDLRTIMEYEIQHVELEEVTGAMAELGILQTRSFRRSSKSPATKGKKPAPTAAAAADVAIDEPQVVELEATKSLLINATPEQHNQIAMIISYVDREPIEAAIPYKIYRLQNQDPNSLEEVLNKLVEKTVKDTTGKIQRTASQEENIEIVANHKTFSLIVYASRKNQEWIGSLIEALDRRRPQVLIDVMLVEITRTDTFGYDLDLVTKLPAMAAGEQMDFLDALIGSGGSSSTFPAKTITELTSSAGTGQGFYADRHIQALLTLMQTKGYGRVLAQPRILVNDNQTGTIDTTNTTYVARTSETVRDTGDTNISTSTSFDSFSSGINLMITPQISEGDLLRLEIVLNRSSQGSAQGATNTPPPDKRESNIDTVVTVPDKSTIILGGILQLDQTKDGGKVPLFGDIPILGGLFRNTNNSDIESKLYIFVKANILRPNDTEEGLPGLERISEQKRVAFEEFEQQFQDYQNWPDGKPEPMDPLKVLGSE